MLKKISVLQRKSIQYGFLAITFANTVMGIVGYTVRDISDKLTWWQCLLILLAAFVVVTVIVYFVLRYYQHRSYTTKINGKSVTIKTGNLFHETGWKVIPFNEYFDTQVDDVIIAHSSLNGIMIDDHIDGKCDELNKVIKDAAFSSSKFLPMLLSFCTNITLKNTIGLEIRDVIPAPFRLITNGGYFLIGMYFGRNDIRYETKRFIWIIPPVMIITIWLIAENSE